MKKILLFISVFLKSTYVQGEPVDYWPLQVGNYWIYKHTKGVIDAKGERLDFLGEIVLEVLSKKEINGNSYFLLNNEQLIRKDKNGNIYEYNTRFKTIEEKDFLIFDFSSVDREDGLFLYRIPYNIYPPKIGKEPLNQNSYLSIMYRSFHNGPINVPIGTFTDFYTFTYGEPISYGAIHIIFALNVGIISSGQGPNDAGEFERYLLLSAKIDGKIYDSTSIASPSWGQLKHQGYKKRRYK